MRIEFDQGELRPLIESVVAATLERMETNQAKLNGRIGYPEAEAASLLGIERHVLRDARLRGEISASRLGKRIVYSPEQLQKFLHRNQI